MSRKNRVPKSDKSSNAADVIGITSSKDDQFPQWYQEVVVKSEMVDYYNEVSGLFVLRPLSMFIWNTLRKWFQDRMDEMDIEEANFPLFLSSRSLELEKNHIAGFAPELAWVTKAGTKDLEVPVALRPTSEAIMYPYFSKWIRSHRDLPLRINQWNSVIRWETKQTTPFLRTREFLWQEGHTAHLDEDSAKSEVLAVLDLYAHLYEEILAVPVVRGWKTDNEKFAGGYYTATVEGYIPTNGRGIQGATSHCLGQNFSKMFNITVEDPDPTSAKGSHVHVWQNSWAFSTRVIGVMVMIHGDDKGLVLPPRVARTQVIIVPVGINKSMSAEDKSRHLDETTALCEAIRAAGIRVDVDDREGYTPAWKFNDWELKGVPLRIEFGPRDAASGTFNYTMRNDSTKGTLRIVDAARGVQEILETVQGVMFAKADAAFKSHRLLTTQWDRVMPALDLRNVLLIPFCLDMKCEEQIKEMTTKTVHDPDVPEDQRSPTMGMKSLCIPFEQPEGLEPGVTDCLNPECKNKAKKWTMFGRSY